MLRQKTSYGSLSHMQENTKIHQENMRLVKAVADGTQGAEGEVLQELINSNERLLAEKEQVLYSA